MKAIEKITVENVRSIVREINNVSNGFDFWFDEENDQIIANLDNFDSLNETLKILNKFDERLKEVQPQLHKLSDLKLKVDGEDGFHAKNLYIQDYDWYFDFSGENKEKEIQDAINSEIEGREFESEEDKEEYIEQWREAFNENYCEGEEHTQFYTNNDPNDLDRVDIKYNGEFSYYIKAPGSRYANNGVSDSLLDFYTNQKAYVFFSEVENEYDDE